MEWKEWQDSTVFLSHVYPTPSLLGLVPRLSFPAFPNLSQLAPIYSVPPTFSPFGNSLVSLSFMLFAFRPLAVPLFYPPSPSTPFFYFPSAYLHTCYQLESNRFFTSGTPIQLSPERLRLERPSGREKGAGTGDGERREAETLGVDWAKRR